MVTIDIVSADVEVDISLLGFEIVDVSVITAKEIVSFDSVIRSNFAVVVLVSVSDFSVAIGETVFVLPRDLVLSMAVNLLVWNDVKKEDILFERVTWLVVVTCKPKDVPVSRYGISVIIDTKDTVKMSSLS